MSTTSKSTAIRTSTACFHGKACKESALDQTNPVKAGRQYQLPADDKAFVLPDDRLGQEKIYVLAFQEPNPALEQLYDALEQARQQQNTTRIADLQNLLLAKLQKAPAVPAFTFVHLEKK